MRLEDDLATVTGTETVVFTPDLDTDELVFRLVPNAPDSAAAGNRLEVDEVTGDDVAGGGYEDAGAGDPGGLYVVELDGELAAGESTEVELTFTLTLGKGTFDRVGTDDGVSWWASGAPLLAWEPGTGWARDPFVGILGETATSTAADGRPDGVGARGPHGADDRRPGGALGARRRPAHLDLDRAGGARRQRGGRASSPPRSGRRPAARASPWACCPIPSCASTASPSGRSTRSPTWRAASAPSPTAR